MRHRMATLRRMIGMVVLGAGVALAQDGPGPMVQPPVEIRPPSDVYPAPPPPSVPSVAAPDRTVRRTEPFAGLRSNAPATAPVSTSMPLVTPPELSLPAGSPTSIDRMQISPTITPRAVSPFPESAAGTRGNPLLPPPGPSTEPIIEGGLPPGMVIAFDEDGNATVIPDPSRADQAADAVIQNDRDRRGLIDGLIHRIDRLVEGRPSPTPRPIVSQPRPTDTIGRSIGRPDDPDDPAAVSALKRRIEQAILRTEHDRIAALEVLIVDRRIHIRVRAHRFWQRGALRRSLEALPIPSGYQATVEVR